MATSSIGTGGGRTYSTIQAWENALPGTLSANEIGECYNDSEFAPASQIDISGTTPGSFRITLTAAATQSFSDAGSGVALKYNQSNGVAIRISNYGGQALTT